MGRYGRRISRSLIGALVVTIVLGLVFYLKDLKSTKAEQTGASAAPVVNKAPAAKPQPKPALTATPVAPTIKPAEQIAMAQSAPPATAPAEPAAANVLADASARKAKGDLLGARRVLNTALTSGRLSKADAASAKQIIAEINQTVIFSPQRFADDEFGGTYNVQSGDVLQKIAAKHEVPWEMLLRLNGMSDPRKLRAGQTLKVVHGPFHAVVYKSTFMLDVWLGDPEKPGSLYVTSFPVGLGESDSTPTGTWQVEAGKKLKNPTYYSPRGEGIIDADDPKNPLGERWIALVGIDGHAVGKASYGIHGTIDESSIGKMESMGCIRLKNADVEWLFDLLVDGKSIVVVKE